VIEFIAMARALDREPTDLMAQLLGELGGG
jgi:hypothetical protein